MSASTTVDLAASVILLRRGQSNGFDVFLTRGPESSAVLAGTYCAPWRLVTKRDFSEAMAGRCFGLSSEQACKILGAEFSPKKAVGLWIAGIRGLFEELGILLAVEESGTGLTPRRAAALASRNHLPFLSLLESAKLRCDLSRLTYFSRWQTPEQMSPQVDTYFFLAVMPDDQATSAHSHDSGSTVWVTPDHALQLFDRGELSLVFPTFSCLRALADFDSLDSVLNEYFRNPVPG